MRTFFLLAAVLSVALALVPLVYEEDPTVIPNHYLVFFKDHVSNHQIDRYIKKYKLEPSHRYDTIFKGFAAVIDEEIVDGMRIEEENLVDRIEREIVQYVLQDCTRQTPAASWGLDRVSRREASSAGYYEYDSTGAGVQAYVLDTGIRMTHQEFTGRVRWGLDAVGEGENDLHGHGTHVAGTVTGTLYGIAKGATAVAVKVCNQFGSCPSSATNAAYSYMANEASSSSTTLTANMSYGGTGGNSACAAIDAASALGVVFVAASGNSNTDSRTFFPASCDSVISVGSTTSSNARSSFSNYGPLVDVFAPGSSIISASASSDTGSTSMSGTSMASPHVCGVATRIIGEHPTWDVESVRAEIIATSTKGAISGLPSGTENRLLYKACAE